MMLFQNIRSGIQGIGLFLGGLRLIEPYSRVGSGLTLEQAQAIAAIRGIRFTVVTYAAGSGAAIGIALGGLTGPAAPVVSPLGGAAGAVLLGGLADWAMNKFENAVLNWGGIQ